MVARGKHLRDDAQALEWPVLELFLQEAQVRGHGGRIVLADPQVEAALKRRMPGAQLRDEAENAPVVPPDGRCAGERQVEEGARLEEGVEDEERAERVSRDRVALRAQRVAPGELGPERGRQVVQEPVRPAARRLVGSSAEAVGV